MSDAGHPARRRAMAVRIGSQYGTIRYYYVHDTPMVWDEQAHLDNAGNWVAINLHTYSAGTARPVGTGLTWQAPGYVGLGDITLQWGINSFTHSGSPPPWQGGYFGYPFHVNETQVVMATLLSTDASVTGISTQNWGQDGFVVEVCRTGPGAGGALAITFSWLAVCQTP